MAVLSATIAAVAAPAAMAMPLGAGVDASNPAPLFQRAAAERHRIYPGSDSSAAEKARSDRNAPNLFCDKQENKCE